MSNESQKKRQYFVAKCANIASLKKCVESGVWACRDKKLSVEHPLEILSRALDEGRVLLVFSVNNCHGWHGYCELIDKPGSYEPGETGQLCLDVQGETTLWHYFRVSWKCSFLADFGEQCLPFSSTELTLVDGTSVNKSRNWQEIPPDVGKEMCRLIDKMYTDLNLKRQKKLDEKLAKRPSPFLKSDALDPVNLREYWAKIVEKVEAELGKVHLACPFGSQRYNLDDPESDIDVFIVYQASTMQLLSFTPPKQTIQNSDQEKCDYTILELHRYCELLCSGDPRCVETLHLDDAVIIHASPEWRRLTELAPLTLTKQLLDKYLRDAQGSNGIKQLKKWRDENPDCSALPTKINKLCYIIIRLLQNARDVVEKGPIRVYRKNKSPERTLLLSIRSGQLSAEEVWKVMDSLQEDIENGKSNLPMESPNAAVEQWMLGQRYSSFIQSPPSTQQET